MRVNHLDPRDYDAQLSWAIHELNGSEGQAAAVLRGAHSALEGARGASMYERAEGYSAGTGFDAYTAGTPVWKVLRAIAPSAKAAPVSWDVGPAMNALNAYLPVGPSSVDHSRSVSIGGTTNNITVNSTDPQSAAAMVGVHLDRTANDISRNLQGAFQ
jgi:hypothetical protein